MLLLSVLSPLRSASALLSSLLASLLSLPSLSCTLELLLS